MASKYLGFLWFISFIKWYIVENSTFHCIIIFIMCLCNINAKNYTVMHTYEVRYLLKFWSRLVKNWLVRRIFPGEGKFLCSVCKKKWKFHLVKWIFVLFIASLFIQYDNYQLVFFNKSKIWELQASQDPKAASWNIEHTGWGQHVNMQK